MKLYNRAFATVMFTLAIALTACGESSTTPNNSQEGEKSSSSQNSLSSEALSSGESLSSNASSAGETSSLALSSFENGLERCEPACIRGTTYAMDERCSRSLHNWIAIVENNQLPSEEYTTLWRDDGECNLIRD